MRLVYRDEALADLAAITDYHTGRGNPELAAAIMREIDRAIQLRTHEALHHAARHNPKNDTFEIVLPRLPYIIVYLPGKSSLDIVAVFHTARHPRLKREP